MKRVLEGYLAAAVLAAPAFAVTPAMAQVSVAQQLAKSCSDAPQAQALDAKAEVQGRKNVDSYATFTQAARLYYACSVRANDPHVQALFTLAYLGDIVGAANAKSTDVGASMNLLRHAQSVAEQLLDTGSVTGDVRTVVLKYRELIAGELQQESALQR